MVRRTALALALLLLLLLLALSSPAGAQPRLRVDGIAALVGGAAPGRGVTTILRSDVELRARIALAGEAPDQPLPIGPLPGSLLRASLDEVIGEILIAREAERVRVALPAGARVARERARLAESAGGAERLRDLLRALGASPDEIETIARRRALVTTFLEANLEGTTVVTDAVVEQTYAAGGHPFEDQPLDQVLEQLRAYLARQAIDHAVGRWVTVLRERTPLRILTSFGEP